RAGGALSAQAEPLDERAVALDVDAAQVTEEAATLTDEEQQTTTAVVVVLVLLEVLGQVLDAPRQQRDLHLGGAGVARVGRVLGDDLLLHCGIQGHWLSFVTRCAERRGTFTRA